MLTKMTEVEWMQYRDFFFELAVDQKHSAYPTYTDGTKTKEDFLREMYRAFHREDTEMLLYSKEGVIEGMVSFYALHEDLYIGISACNIRNGMTAALQEIWDYLSKRFSGFTLYFGIPDVNREAIEFFSTNAFSLEENSFVDVMHFDKYCFQPNVKGIKRISEGNFEIFAAIHSQHDDDMYWNNERLKSNLAGGIFMCIKRIKKLKALFAISTLEIFLRYSALIFVVVSLWRVPSEHC